LLLIAVVGVALVTLLAAVSSRVTQTSRPASPSQVASNIDGGATATADEVQRLKSWGLTAAEMPAGSSLRVAEELKNYGVVRGDPQLERQIAESGRIDGYYQEWEQTTAQMQFELASDLYTSNSAAMSVVAQIVKADASKPIQNLPDPKLGDFSRMYGFTSQTTGGPKFEGWVVQWVRGRSILYIKGVAAVGELHQEDILTGATRIDAKAKQSPIK
jgi:hypothetical protein